MYIRKKKDFLNILTVKIMFMGNKIITNFENSVNQFIKLLYIAVELVHEDLS